MMRRRGWVPLKTQALGLLYHMPTVLRLGGLRVTIYPNDHRPAHVHVIGAGKEAVFDLHCPAGPPELRENYGFSRSEATRIAVDLAARLAELCHAWERTKGRICPRDETGGAPSFHWPRGRSRPLRPRPRPGRIEQ